MATAASTPTAPLALSRGEFSSSCSSFSRRRSVACLLVSLLLTFAFLGVFKEDLSLDSRSEVPLLEPALLFAPHPEEEGGLLAPVGSATVLDASESHFLAPAPFVAPTPEEKGTLLVPVASTESVDAGGAKVVVAPGGSDLPQQQQSSAGDAGGGGGGSRGKLSPPPLPKNRKSQQARIICCREAPSPSVGAPIPPPSPWSKEGCSAEAWPGASDLDAAAALSPGEVAWAAALGDSILRFSFDSLADVLFATDDDESGTGNASIQQRYCEYHQSYLPIQTADPKSTASFLADLVSSWGEQQPPLQAKGWCVSWQWAATADEAVEAMAALLGCEEASADQPNATIVAPAVLPPPSTLSARPCVWPRAFLVNPGLHPILLRHSETDVAASTSAMYAWMQAAQQTWGASSSSSSLVGGVHSPWGPGYDGRDGAGECASLQQPLGARAPTFAQLLATPVDGKTIPPFKAHMTQDVVDAFNEGTLRVWELEGSAVVVLVDARAKELLEEKGAKWARTTDGIHWSLEDTLIQAGVSAGIRCGKSVRDQPEGGDACSPLFPLLPAPAVCLSGIR